MSYPNKSRDDMSFHETRNNMTCRPDHSPPDPTRPEKNDSNQPDLKIITKKTQK